MQEVNTYTLSGMFPSIRSHQLHAERGALWPFADPLRFADPFSHEGPLSRAEKKQPSVCVNVCVCVSPFLGSLLGLTGVFEGKQMIINEGDRPFYGFPYSPLWKKRHLN